MIKAVKKLDINSLNGWKNHTSTLKDFPSFADLKQFLFPRAVVIETIESKNVEPKQQFKFQKEN